MRGVWSHQGDVIAIRTYFFQLHEGCSIFRIPRGKSFNMFFENVTKRCCHFERQPWIAYKTSAWVHLNQCASNGSQAGEDITHVLYIYIRELALSSKYTSSMFKNFYTHIVPKSITKIVNAKHFKSLQFNQLYKINEKRQRKGTTQDKYLRT